MGEGMGVVVCVRQFTCQPALLCCRCLPWIDTLIVFVMLLHEQVSKTFTEHKLTCAGLVDTWQNWAGIYE